MIARKARPREQDILIEREECDTNYTVMPNEAANDPLLSFPAKGMLWYICSKPPSWKVVPEQLKAEGKISLPKARKLLAELIKAGYARRDFVRDDRKRIVGIRYFFCTRPKYREAVSSIPATREIYQTENASPVVSNDRYKSPPQSPPTQAEGEQQHAPSLAATVSEKIRPQGGELRSPTEAAPAATAEGSAGKETCEALKPVTLTDLKRQYEAHNSRKLAKADEAWPELSVDQQVHAVAVLPQYFAHCARIGKKPVELWKFLRLGVFRQYPPPKKPGELPPPKELPPDPGDVLGTELGLRAAHGRWVLELVEFIERHRRLPDHAECDGLARAGAARHRELLEQERAVRAGKLIAPMVPVFLAKRRNLIAKALRLHWQSPPDDGASEPPVKPHWPAARERTAETGPDPGIDPGEQFAEAHYGTR